MRTSKFVIKLEVTDSNEWLMDLDESLPYSFHIEVTTISYSRCPDIGVISIQHITVFSQNCTSDSSAFDFIFTRTSNREDCICILP